MLEIFLKIYKIIGASTCIIFFILAILWQIQTKICTEVGYF